MNIFISGIAGAGLGPLAEIALDAGANVVGSDIAPSMVSRALEERGVSILYEQNQARIAAAHATTPIDWLIYTAALPNDAPELQFARSHGIRISKRDEFLTEFIKKKHLRLIAVAGTHGKTATTGLLIWAAKQLGLPVSYAVGTTISFGASGQFNQASEYFIYEADEYDRNFLNFNPEIAVLPSVDYDHADIYPTVEAYKAAFRQFISQANQTVLFEPTFEYLQPLDNADVAVFDHQTTRDEIDLAGQHMRNNAFLAAQTLRLINDYDETELFEILGKFPGTARRFEKLAENLYTDYAHHPAEIAAVVQLARELSDNVVVVYQPHQNLRQTEIAGDYHDAFNGAAQVYWLPTYLVRDDLLKTAPAVLSPTDLIKKLSNSKIAVPAEMNDALWQKIEQARAGGALVLVMGAGTIDGWLRDKLGATNF
jgi:UDP-N-acetylmuramate--alanine ligase